MPTVSAYVDVSGTDSAVAGIGSCLDVPTGDDIPNDPGWNSSPFRPSHFQIQNQSSAIEILMLSDKYRVSHLLGDPVWYTQILSVPLFAQFCLG